MAEFLRKINADKAKPGDFIKLGGKYEEITHVAKGFDGGIYAFTHENDDGYIIQEGSVEIYSIFRKEGN